MDHTQKLVKIDYHRNGISGLGFHVGIVEEKEEGKTRRMLVVRFPKKADDDTGNVVCAAFDLAQLKKEIIEFGHNSWRGDYYFGVMDEAIAKEEEEYRRSHR
jgi:hypothetical protein